jgi:hypothetical protein
VNPVRAGEVPLAGPLSALVPDARQTLLLRAALYPPAPASDALRTWLGGTRFPARDLGAGSPGGRLLAPLIAHNLAGTGETEPERLWTYLRTALVHEQLRASATRAICRQALESLDASGIAPVILRGIAASETVYPAPGLRHSHDLDMFVPPETVDAAGKALAASGFRPAPALGVAPETRHFAHASGMPVALHTELVQAPLYRRRPETLLTGTRRAPFSDRTALLLDPTAQVTHLLLHAASAPSRATLLWACDAWLTIRRTPALDWTRLTGEVTARRAALPVTILLTYLARALAAPIPDEALAALADTARRATRVDKEVALWGAWASRETRFDRALSRAAGAGERAFLLRWRLAPGPDALVLAGRVAPGRGRLRFYLGRPWRLLARGVGRAGRIQPAGLRQS